MFLKPRRAGQSEWNFVLDLLATSSDRQPPEGRLLDPGGDVDPVAVDVRAAVDDVAHVKSDAQPDLFAGSGSHVPLIERFLDFDGAEGGLERAGELD